MSAPLSNDQKLADLKKSAWHHLKFWSHNRVGYGVDAAVLIALIEVAEAANNVCIAQDGYLIELMDKLHKLEAM